MKRIIAAAALALLIAFGTVYAVRAAGAAPHLFCSRDFVSFPWNASLGRTAAIPIGQTPRRTEWVRKRDIVKVTIFADFVRVTMQRPWYGGEHAAIIVDSHGIDGRALLRCVEGRD